MKAFRFLHAADLHLDSPFRGMMSLPSGIRERVRESTFLALRKMVRTAIEQKVDFVILSGDIYDLADRSLRAQIRFQQAMEQLAEHSIAAFVIHGNHDPEDGRRAALSWPENVHFFGSSEAGFVPVQSTNGRVLAHVHGISYPTSSVTVNMAPYFSVKDHSVYNIALLHANVDGDPSHDNYAPCRKQDLLRCGMDYWALGHIHTRQVVHSNPYVVYPGNIQGRSVREVGPKGCYVVDVSETGDTSLTFHAADALRWFQEHILILGINTEQELKNRIEQQMAQVRLAAEGRPAMVRLIFNGRGSIHRLLQNGTHLQELLAELRDQEAGAAGLDDQAPFVWIESCKVRSGLPVDKEQLMEQNDFLGDFLRISRTLMHNEAELRAFCEQTLSPLSSHMKAGKYLASMNIEELIELLQAAEEIAVNALLEDAGWDE